MKNKISHYIDTYSYQLQQGFPITPESVRAELKPCKLHRNSITKILNQVFPNRDKSHSQPQENRLNSYQTLEVEKWDHYSLLGYACNKFNIALQTMSGYSDHAQMRAIKLIINKTTSLQIKEPWLIKHYSPIKIKAFIDFAAEELKRKHVSSLFYLLGKKDKGNQLIAKFNSQYHQATRKLDWDNIKTDGWDIDWAFLPSETTATPIDESNEWEKAKLYWDEQNKINCKPVERVKKKIFDRISGTYFEYE